MKWTIQHSDEFDRRHKRFRKKRPRELAAVLDNLDTVIAALNEGAKSPQIKFGFIHPEPLGLLAIDQKGGGKNLAETRLYILADDSAGVVYAITVGDKQSQAGDIEFCKQFVRDWRARKIPETAEQSEDSSDQPKESENEDDREDLP
jgi:hypothetical protein